MQDLSEIFWDQLEVVEHWEKNLDVFSNPGDVQFKISQNLEIFEK